MRGPRARALGLRHFTTAVIRDYQAHMATRRWSVNTVRRRLVELNRPAPGLAAGLTLGEPCIPIFALELLRVSPGGR